MKKVVAIIITIVLMITLVACSGTQTVNAPSEEHLECTHPTSIFNNVYIQNMYVYIDDGDGGSYVLLSDGEITHDVEYGTCEVLINDPALLAFKVSEKYYPGGVGTLSGEEIESMISSIEIFLNENNIDKELKVFIESILQQIKDIPVIEGAST